MLGGNYYLVLGVSREESQSGIRKAFRRLVKRYHPDVVGPKWRSQYQDIVMAYEVLSDPVKRESYNRGLDQANDRSRRAAAPIVTDYERGGEYLFPGPASVVRDFRTAGDPLVALLERFVRNFTGINVPKAERPQSLTVEILLTPDEALRGGRLPLKVPVVYPCPYCHGSGEIWPLSCGACSGQGMVQEDETVMLIIPPRVRSGTVFEIPLHGLGVHNLFLRALVRIGGAND